MPIRQRGWITGTNIPFLIHEPPARVIAPDWRVMERFVLHDALTSSSSSVSSPPPQPTSPMYQNEAANAREVTATQRLVGTTETLLDRIRSASARLRMALDQLQGPAGEAVRDGRGASAPSVPPSGTLATIAMNVDVAHTTVTDLEGLLERLERV